MLPSRGVENLASSVMRYAKTSSGRKVIGAGMAAGGTGALLYGYNRNPNRVSPAMGAGAFAAVGGYSMIASGMR